MVDYSKWENIEISDDEDTAHPITNAAALLKMQHATRVKYLKELQHEKEEYYQRKGMNINKVIETKKKIARMEPNSPELESLNKVLAELEEEEKEIQKKGDELLQREKNIPCNTAALCGPGFTKSFINAKALLSTEKVLTEDEKAERLRKHIRANEKLMKQFAMLESYNDSNLFLSEHSMLVCEDTVNFLVIWCINLEMEKKHEQMEHVAHQTICVQYILELAKQFEVDPRACIESFFAKIQIAGKTYRDAFNEEFRKYVVKIKQRAVEKALRNASEEEVKDRAARLGPGGLDPVEVYAELPDELKRCFDNHDVTMLQQAMSRLPQHEAYYYMKRCVDSGLWMPTNNTGEMKEEAAAAIMKENTEPDEKMDTL